MRKLFWLLLLMLLLPTDLVAQDVPFHTWEVYIEQDIDVSGTDRLHFVDLQFGDTTSIDVDGERYTPVNDYVLFFDRAARAVMKAHPDGTVTPHPFIALGAARRVDWIISADQRLIAWTLTYSDANGLTTITSLASPTGTNQDLVLSDGPRTDGARALPVAFTVDNSALVFDSQPDGIGDLAPYQQYANLFELSLVNGTITPMAGEPSCFCAAALRAGQLLRLAITDTLTGFDVQYYNLTTDTMQTIPAPQTINYTQGGNILISPDGTQAVYVLSQVSINEGTVNSVLMLVDLVSMTQMQLGETLTSYVRPVKWTEDNTAILYTVPDRNGTWKVTAIDGMTTQISRFSYIGVIEN